VETVLAGLLLVIGLFFLGLASLGILRLPDLFTRMHAASKAATLGITGALLAAAVCFSSTPVTTKVVLALFFQFLTTPVATHMIALSARRAGIRPWEAEAARPAGPEGEAG